MVRETYNKIRTYSLPLNLENLVQLSQVLQKVLIFEYCKIDNAIGNVL